jgi:predicted Fe-S protein YdhL (DUF1289 family)
MRQVIPDKERGTLEQVWMQLSDERQAGVIQLMAQLVLKLVVAQSDKEPRDEQNPV